MIPKVENAGLILEYRSYNELQDNRVAKQRMIDGAQKYGTSWAEVNLKKDMLEEAYDLMNYALLGIVRIEKSKVPMNTDDYEALLTIREMAKDIIVQIGFLPDFEGPSSNEWIEANAI